MKELGSDVEIAQNDKEIKKVPYALCVSFVATSAIIAQISDVDVPTSAYVASAGFYILGRVADRVTTIRSIKEAKKANDNDIDLGLVEHNPMFPKQPTVDAISSRDKYIVDASCLTGGIIIPPIGALFGFASFAVATANTVALNRAKKRHSIK